jgi:alpha-L-fucosidase
MTVSRSEPAPTDWFVRDRFGLFLHWGLYALPARHEWVKNRERIPDELYDRYFPRFDPDLYDPAQWARSAREAGMKYMVITSKHHEGFCLWDSRLTDYKATNTPSGRDLLRPLLEAFRNEGLRVGLYHSLIDWHHPDFPIDGLHPMRDDVEFREAQEHRDIRKYAEYLHAQVRELLTDYGRIDIMWFDFSYSGQDWGWSRGKGKDDWQAESLLAMVRELQPDILVNDRLEMDGDFRTPEQVQPSGCVQQNGRPVPWEACQTLNGSWGYDRDNLDWKPTRMLLWMLIDAVSKGGNMLLNVGPNARGAWEPAAKTRLGEIGRWMRLHNRSIYGCGPSRFQPPPDARYTQNGERLYLHLFAWPFRHVRLPGLADRIEYAQLLNDASEIRYSREGDTDGPGATVLELPIQAPPVEVPVIELLLREEPSVD